jgi:hypothetical protein
LEKKETMLILAGLILLVILSVPARVYFRIFSIPGSVSFDFSWGLYAVAAIFAAHAVAALLFFSALRVVTGKGGETAAEVDGKNQNRKAAFSAILGVALLGKALHIQYWLLVWDSTYDPFGLFWLIFILLLVVLVWSFLVFGAPDRLKPLALSPIVAVPVLVIVCGVVALRTDFRQLTMAHAERVNRAIEAYYDREGHYPDTLRRLTFREASVFPEPIILPGQTWCYDGGADYYRLGYVDRNHWSDPNLFGHLHDAEGELPDRPPLCTTEIAVLRNLHPSYFGLSQD